MTLSAAFSGAPRALAAEETIVALATPPGEGALAIVRLSGPDAVSIADRLFRGSRRLAEAPSRAVQLGTIRRCEGDETIDQVLAVVMKGPRSYTGEDIVEFTGHGGTLVSRLLVEAAVEAGARPAQPGEFTRRAFQNGRIDLAQAEAVVDLIQARGERAVRNALSQLNGGLSARIGIARQAVLDVLAPLEAFIDFGDDVPEPPGIAEMIPRVMRARDAVDQLLAGDRRGRLISDGATIVLAGKPNVGKSSLFNALAGLDRALVHDVPGTTRDTIEVCLSLDGVPVNLVDTAGIRTTSDPVEKAGVDRSHRAVAGAQVVILVVDASRAPDADDRRIAKILANDPVLLVRNKSDLGDEASNAEWARETGWPVRLVSAAAGSGIDRLLGDLTAHVLGDAGGEEGVTMTRARHYEALRRARAALDRALETIESRAFADMTAAELREALQSLGEVTGENAGPDILDRIFSSFCIGK
jgi:tRNA modification GTPase